MLNPEQHSAVYCNDKNILCLAGAGTGKTYSMIERLKRIIEEDNVPPSQVLVLTFTNAAALEMEERYKNSSKSKYSPYFGTFHSFCYMLILSDSSVRHKLGYSNKPELITDADDKLIYKYIVSTLNLKISKSKLNNPGVLTREEQREYDLYHKMYYKELKRRNLITFDIMCYEVCALFKKDEECVSRYRNKYKHIFVDEFQDTDKLQWEFLQSFPSDVNKFVVGDVKQAIYGFRGADSSIIKDLADSEEWTTVKLVRNYRSSEQICNYANSIGKQNTSYSIALVSEKQGPKVKNYYHSEDDELFLYDLCKRTENSNSLAILARTNAEVEGITWELQHSGIPFETKSSSSEVLDILQSCIDKIYMVKWLALKLSAKSYNKFLSFWSLYKDREESEIVESFLDMFGNDWKLRDAITAINQVNSIVENESKFPIQKVQEIKILLSIPNKNVCTIKDDKVIEWLIDDYSNMKEENSNKQSIYVGTIHSVKGLEFDSVILVGVNGKSFKLDTEENLNLFYVGVTRAKTNLYIQFIDSDSLNTMEEDKSWMY